MGLNEDRFNAGQKFPGRSSKYKYPWGYFDPDRGELVVSRKEIFSSRLFSLKDIEYFIEDGILYLKAVECEWEYIGNYLMGISEWKSPHRYMFILSKDEDFTKKFHVDLDYLVENYKYRKNWRNRTANIIDCSPKERAVWFRKKEVEKEFTYTLHPFKLREI